MFAGVTCRNAGDPWPAHGMTSALWLEQPVAEFTLSNLQATQPGVLFSALIRDEPPVGGDSYPHVVIWQGVQYLEDGHHRAVRAMLAGEETILARYVVARHARPTTPLAVRTKKSPELGGSG